MDTNKKTEVTEDQLIFDKKYMCYACEKHFTAKTVKTGKSRLIRRDLDMRPRYDNIDSVKYGTLVCPHCGYAVMERFYRPLTKSQKAAIQNAITTKYSRPEDIGAYSYETARARTEIVLLNALARNAKDSERSYIYLYLAWLVRGQREAMEQACPDSEQCAKLQEQEAAYLKYAAEGFVTARRLEPLPMCGMDEQSLDYLLSALLYEVGRYDEAGKLVINILTNRFAKKQIKDKADRLKDMIKASREHNWNEAHAKL